MTRKGWLVVLLGVMGLWWNGGPGVAGTDVSASTPTPAEQPPDDFAAAQYIDSVGCVFTRSQRGWTARVARDGQAICGYPPTLSARRTGPDTLTALRAAPPEAPSDRITRALVTTVMAGLHTGELAGFAPAGGGDQPRDEPVAGQPVETGSDFFHLPQMIASAPALRQAIAQKPGRSRLCDLLGAGIADGTALGGAAMGACGSLKALALEPRRAAGPPAGSIADRTSSAKKVAGAGPGATAIVARPAEEGGKAAVAARQVRRDRTSATTREMVEPRIAAGARYVQVGIFADDVNAVRTARRLTALGLPVSRERITLRKQEVQAIMAGPFDSRQSLVRALARIRDAGFKDAYPR